MDKDTTIAIERLLKKIEKFEERLRDIPTIEKSLKLVPLSLHGSMAHNINIGTTELWGGSLPAGSIIKKVLFTCLVNTTNGSMNYWTISLYQPGPLLIGEFHTSSYSPGVWITGSPASLSNTVMGASSNYVYIDVSKFQTPGALEMYAPMVLYS